MNRTYSDHMTPDEAISLIQAYRASQRNEADWTKILKEAMRNHKSREEAAALATATMARDRAEEDVRDFVDTVKKAQPPRWASFLQGFSMAGFFGRVGIPGSPTQVFADLEDEGNPGRFLELRLGDKIFLIDAER